MSDPVLYRRPPGRHLTNGAAETALQQAVGAWNLARKALSSWALQRGMHAGSASLVEAWQTRQRQLEAHVEETTDALRNIVDSSDDDSVQEAYRRAHAQCAALANALQSPSLEPAQRTVYQQGKADAVALRDFLSPFVLSVHNGQVCLCVHDRWYLRAHLSLSGAPNTLTRKRAPQNGWELSEAPHLRHDVNRWVGWTA